jgi:molybdate transport system regulatory protein
MKIRHKIWLESEGKVIFGQGRQELFRAVEACGSLNAAAKKLGMSYRAAWGRVRASEQRLGIPLIERGTHEKGGHLTLEARKLLDRYEKMEERVNDFIEKISDQFSRSLYTGAAPPNPRKDGKILACVLSALTAQLIEFPTWASLIETTIPML